MTTLCPTLDPAGGLVLAAVPSGPSTGGGGDAASGRRALWGIGAVATSPDAFEGRARRRLVRAATVTSVMGLAWASTTTPAVSTRPAPGKDAQVADAATPGEDVALVSPFDRWIPADATAPTPTPAPSPPGDSRAADPIEDRNEARKRDKQERRERRRAQQRRKRREEAEAQRRREARQEHREQRARERREQEERERAAAEAAANAWRSHPIASHEQVVIVQPSPHVQLVGFHEAAIAGARSLGLAAAPDAHHGRDWVPHLEHPDDDLLTMVLPSRGRGTHSATAIDVAVPAGRTIHAPVSGVVTTVEPYLLYGQHADTRLVIRPHVRPDLRLVVLHVTGHAVAVGDHVEAGVTPIAASATPFPFESQVDRFTRAETGTATPHVHLELRGG